MRARLGRQGLAALAAGLVLSVTPWAAPAGWADDATAADTSEPAAKVEPAPRTEPESAPAPEPKPVSESKQEPKAAAEPEPETMPASTTATVERQSEPSAPESPSGDPEPVAVQEPASAPLVAAGSLTTESEEPTTESEQPAPPSAEPDPAAPDTESVVVGGDLRWGLKESFRSYIVGPIAHGSITLTAPATTDGAVISYPATSGSWPSEVKTAGGVRYYGHNGDLDLTLSNLRLRVGGTAILLVDAVSSDGVTHPDLEFASVDLAGVVTTGEGTVSIAGARTWLTTAGSVVFAYNGSPMYPAGTELDPLNATLQVQGSEPAIPTVPAEPVPTPAPTPTPTSPATPTPSAPATPDKSVQAGSLTWGVKASFRSYVTGPIARGSIAISGGATSSGSGYRFGQASTTADLPDPVGSTRFRGKVRFTGHQGELDLTFADPVVRVISGNAAVLSMSVTGYGRVDLATLDLGSASRSTSTGAVTFRGAPATLTSAGSKVFSYQGSTFYPSGTKLDSVTFTVGSKAPLRSTATQVVARTKAAAWRPPEKAPATRGLALTGEPVAGGTIAVTGSGFRPNEPGIRVVLYSAPIVLATDVTANAKGVATWRGTLPAGITPGIHTLTFQGTVDRGVRLEVTPPQAVAGCAIVDASLSWGFKESFRAYVSGSIANGDWSTSGNAGYQTPVFTWSKGDGTRAEDGEGRLGFTGAIRFTGHSGALDTSIADPVVQFTADSAVLTVDYAGTSMDDALAGKENRQEIAGVPFVDLDLAKGVTTTDQDVVTISDIPTSLTEAGSAAFPNYPAGTAFDPVTLSYRTDPNCVPGESAPAEPEPTRTPSPSATPAASPAPAPVAAADQSGGWVPWVGGGAIGAVVAATATVLVMRRRGAAG